MNSLSSLMRRVALISLLVLLAGVFELMAANDLPPSAAPVSFATTAYQVLSYNGSLGGVATADLNNDGNLDLAVSLDFGVAVLIGNGHGQFQLVASYPLPQTSIVTVSDFNRDGKIDLAVETVNGVAVLLGNGDGTFQAPVFWGTYLAGGLSAADMNGDGTPDLVYSSTPSSTNNVYVLLGNGDGTFRPSISAAAGAGPLNSFALGDFNQDGKLDVAILNGFGGAYSILLGNGDGTLQPSVLHAIRPAATGIVSADLNGDGKADLILCGTTSPSPWIVSLVSLGDGTFQDKGRYAAGDTGLITGDFNHDGKVDVAVLTGPTIQQFASTGAILDGNGDGTFRPAMYFTTPHYDGRLAVGDFNNDGKMDLAIAPTLSSSVWAYLQTEASLAPLAVNFSSHKVGTSTPTAVTLTNDGHNNLTGIKAAITGLGAQQFSTSSLCGASLSPGASCSITVTFTPTKGGIHQAALDVFDSDASPQSVPLQGQGTK